MAQFAIDEILTTGIQISGFIFDVSNSTGPTGYVLTSTSSGVMWKLDAGSEDIQATGTLLNNRINSLSGYVNGTFLSGSGIQNYVPRWNTARELVTGSIYDLGTGVGIGTTSPAAKLNVYGGNTVFRNDVAAGTSAVFIRNWASSPSTSLIFGNNPSDDSSTTLDLTANVFSITNYGDPGSSIKFGTRNDSTADIRVTIDPSGRVGIGAVNLSSLLTVGGAGSANSFSGISFGEDTSANLYRISTARLQTDGSLTIGGQGGLATALTLNRSSTSNENGIAFNSLGSTDWYYYVDGGNTHLQIQRSSEIDSAPRVRFDGANSNILFNLGGGNVGIGTTNPQNKLSVIGGVNIGSLAFNTEAPTSGLIVEGSVGIGINSPSGKLHLTNMGFTSQSGISDTNSFPNATGVFGLVLDNNTYTDGRYRHRFVKVDRAGNLPLYLQQAGGTANSYLNLVRFGTHSYSTDTFEVFGDSKVNGNLSIGSDLYVADELGVGVPITGKRFGYGAEIEVASASIQLVLGRLGNATGQGGIGADANNTFAVWNVSGQTTKQFVVSQQGNVGIQETNPLAPLHVGLGGDWPSSTGTSAMVFIKQNTSNVGLVIQEPGGSNFDRALHLYTNSSVATIDATYRDTGPYPHLAFVTSGTERVRIASNGLVGISSNIPTDFLDFGGAGKNIVFGYAAYGEVLNSAASIIGNNVKASPTAFSQVRRFANTNDQGNFIKLIYNKGVTFHTNITSALNTDISEDTNERMRINLSGNVIIGNITAYGGLTISDITANDGNDSLAFFYRGTAGAHESLIKFHDFRGQNNASIGNNLQDDTLGGQKADLVFKTARNSSPIERMRITSLGNVGIGTSSPSKSLHIYNTGLFNNTVNSLLLIDGKFNVGSIDTDDIVGIAFRIENSGGGSQITNSIGSCYQAGGNALLLQPEGGNVGIGLKNPIYKLQLQADNPTNGVLAQFYNYNAAAAGANGAFTIWTQYGIADWFIGQPSGVNALTFGRDKTSSATGVEYIRINNVGNVGIGSINPTQKLDVAGYVMAGDGLYRTSTYGTNGGAWISFGDTGVLDSLGRVGAYGSLFNINSINGDTSFQYNGSEKMRITTAGNVGIGVTNPGVRLQVVNTGSATSTSTVRIVGATGNGGGSQIEFFKGTSQKFSIGTASAITGGLSDDLLLTTLNPSSIILTAGLSGLAIFKTDGKVGIGMYNPTTLLSVGSVGSTTAASGITFGSDPEVNLYRSAENVLKTDGSLIITDSLGVGLSPTQKLQVDGVVGNPALNGTNQSGIFRISNTTDNAVLDFGIRAGGLGAWIQSTDETSLDAYYPLLLNPNGARVGVGLTTNISGILHVRTPAAGDQTLLVLEHSAGYGNNTENRIDFFDDEPHKIAARIAQYYSTDSNNRWGLKFYTNPSAAINPTPALTLRGNNNVGVGTASPIERLHISGNIHVQAESNSVGGNGIYLGGVTNRYLAIRQTSTDKDFAFDTYNDTESWVNRLTILNNGGNVGINSTAPNTKLRVNGSFSQRASGTTAIQEYKNIVTFSLDGNGNGGYVVKTPFRIGSTYEMVIIHVKGYGYGIATLYDFKVVFYDYQPSHAPVSYSIIDLGNDGSPKYLAKDADNYVQVCFGSPADVNNYFYRFTVDCITTRQGNDYSQGWGMYQTTGANFGFASTGVYQLNSPVNFRTTNFVGIGTTNPQNRLSVIGSVNIGSNNFNSTAPTNGLIVEGNVGIGISSTATYINSDATSFRPNPAGKFLDVYSSANEANINLITNNSGDGSGIGGIYFTRARGQSDNHYQIAAIKAVQGGTNGLIAGGKLYFYTKSNGGATLATAPAMTIATDSNVGIGTTVPNSILEVYKVPATSGTLQPMLTITSDYPSAITTNFGSSIVFKGRTAGNVLQDNAQIAAYNEDLQDNGYALGFYTRPSVGSGIQQRMTILRGGNVGINTTTPNARLQIGGTSINLLTVGTLTNDWGGVVSIGTPDGNGIILSKVNTANDTNRVLTIMRDDTNGASIFGYTPLGTSTSIGFQIRASGSSYFNGGNVGIGTASPSFKLTVQGITQARGGVYVTQASPTNTLVLNADSTALHKIYTNSTIDLSLGTNFSDTQVYLKNGGNVGVGQNNPIEKLHVQGNVYATDGNLFNFKAQRIPIEGSPQGGTYKGYLILAKAYTSGFVDQSYVIGKVILRRGTSGTGHNVDIYEVNSSRGYNTEIFQVSRLGAIGTRFVRLVKVTYGGVVYHAIETESSGGAPSTEMYFEGSIVESPLILTDESFVSNVTAFGNITIFVDQSSNVGIGTTTPSNKLDVIGSSYLSGIVYVGLAGHTTNAHGIVFGGDSEANIYRAATDTIKTDGNLIVAGNVTAANLVSGSGTSNYVTKWNGTKSITNSQIFDDGTYVGINTASNTTYRLQVNGSFAATTKSFDIVHPTISGKRLIYASLEGPENGVYFRGRNNNNEINLPHYWSGLVHDDSITVDLTSVGKRKDGKIRNYSVDQIGHNKVYIYTDSDDNIYDYYYTIFAERKDVCRLITERDME